MLISTLPWLRCPSFIDESPACGGELIVLEAHKKKSTDILFGTLSCKKCEATYPILSGVAVLVNDVEQYLQFHVKGVSATVKDSEIPEIYREIYQLAKAHIETGLTEEDLESQRINALYCMNHYLSASKSKGKPWWRPKKELFSKEIDQLIKSFWDNGPFFKISEWIKPLKKQAVIELGCGVGGLAQIFSKAADSYLGVDSAFASIVLARQIYLRSTNSISIKFPQDLFSGPLTGSTALLRPPQCKNLDFVVGELENLPVEMGRFDLSVVLNAIDMIEDPRQLPKIQYDLLRENGIAIQSGPYIWHRKVAENLRKSLPARIKTSSTAVEFLYEKAGFKIFKKIEHLPWLFLKHFRQVEMYSVHLFMAKKNSP